MAREIRLTENEDFKTVARTTANVGSGLVAVDGLTGFDQIDIGPADIGLEPDACDSVIGGGGLFHLWLKGLHIGDERQLSMFR
jgi:hypothetical protein